MAAEVQVTLPLGVTIVIADGSCGLPRAVDSALAGVRALADWGIPAEALVAGDRSNDGQVRLLHQLEALYYGQGLRVFLSRQPGDAGAARSFSLRCAAYRYVVYLGGNDELVADALPLFYRAMRDTQAVLVYGNMIAHRPDGVILINNDNALRRLAQEPATIDLCAIWDRLQLDDGGGLEDGLAIPATAEQGVRPFAGGRRLVFVPAVFGHHHHAPGARDAIAHEQGAYPPHPQHVGDQADQQGQNDPKRQLLRYHPDLGYF